MHFLNSVNIKYCNIKKKNYAVADSTPHQHNFSLVNIGGTQGQILIQSSTPASANNVQSAGGTQMGQTNLILRTVTPTQQLLQQQHSSHLQTPSSSGQTVNVATSQVILVIIIKKTIKTFI